MSQIDHIHSHQKNDLGGCEPWRQTEFKNETDRLVGQGVPHREAIKIARGMVQKYNGVFDLPENRGVTRAVDMLGNW